MTRSAAIVIPQKQSNALAAIVRGRRDMVQGSRGRAGRALIGLAALGGSAWAAEPSSLSAPALTVGDEWVYDSVVEQGTSGFQENHYQVRIEDIRDDGLIVGIKRQGAPTAFKDQEMGTDGSERRLEDGRPVTGDRPFDFPMAVGKTWEADFEDPTRYGLQTSAQVHKVYKVTGWEDVHTPAGDFHALKIEAHGTLKAQIAAGGGVVGGAVAGAGEATSILHSQIAPAHVNYATTYVRVDYAPEVRSFVKSVRETYNASGVRIRRETRTLESFKPAS